jgi:hypothetical protein
MNPPRGILPVRDGSPPESAGDLQSRPLLGVQETVMSFLLGADLMVVPRGAKNPALPTKGLLPRPQRKVVAELLAGKQMEKREDILGF